MTMARESVEQLRSAIVADTAELATLKERRDALRKQAAEVGKAYRTVEARRVRRIKRARDAGATAEQLAADANVTPARIRQVAPTQGGKLGRPPKKAAVDLSAAHHIAEAVAGRPSPAAAVVDYVRNPLARTAEQRARVEQLAAEPFPPTPTIEPGQLSGIARAVHELTSATASTSPPVVDDQDQDDEPAGVVRLVPREQLPPVVHEEQLGRTVRGKTPASSPQARKLLVSLQAARGVAGIVEKVREVMQRSGGDVDRALFVLKKEAIPDAMTLLDACRAGSTYDYTAHPSIPDPLKRPGKKQADMIWEGRPRYKSPVTLPGMEVDALDVNGAYLSALRRVHLPIGRLVEDAPGTPFDRRRSGIYLIEPIVWRHRGMPNPLGDGREEKGPVWISGATMRLLLRAEKLGFGTAPVVLESWTSGASENLLTKFGDTLAAARREALLNGDEVMLEYVKAMYSKFVSTAGDSRMNHDVFRPDWVHEIRSQAYANLWYKAAKAKAAGICIYRMSGTDELHLAAAWRDVRDDKGQPLFRLGRELSEMKIKGTYRVGDDA